MYTCGLLLHSKMFGKLNLFLFSVEIDGSDSGIPLNFWLVWFSLLGKFYGSLLISLVNKVGSLVFKSASVCVTPSVAWHERLGKCIFYRSWQLNVHHRYVILVKYAWSQYRKGIRCHSMYWYIVSSLYASFTSRDSNRAFLYSPFPPAHSSFSLVTLERFYLSWLFTCR